MEVSIPDLNYSFSIGITNVLCVLGGAVIMFFFDRWVLGRKARKAIRALEGERDDQRVKNAALEARISVLECFSQEQTGGGREGARHRRAAFPTDQHGPLADQDLGASRASATAPDQRRTHDIWSTSPGAGRAAAKLIITVSTLEEARDVYGAFKAAPKKSDVIWANWSFLYRLEEEGCGREVFSEAFTLAEEGQEIIADEEIWKTILRWRQDVLED